MAYGKEPLRPGRNSDRFANTEQPLVRKAQKGKTGQEGASKHKFGGMPSSGNFEGNAGSSEAEKGGATEAMGQAPASQGKGPAHVGLKTPRTPGSSGGDQTGSLDTLTSLFFHPKGGFANKPEKSGVRPKASGKYKDSGRKGPPETRANIGFGEAR